MTPTIHATHGIQGITESDIANYLVNTPSFFERHAELLGSVQLTSPHGHRAVSLQERQMEMLREKIRGLEGKIIEMMRNGQDNIVLVNRLHRCTLALMLTPQLAELPTVLLRELMHEFMIPQAAVRVWGTAQTFAAQDAAQPVTDDTLSLATSLIAPYCGANTGFEAVQWLQDPAQVRSMALIPLRASASGLAEDRAPVFGLLVLASPDATRYTAEMGTELLTRIGDIAGAALARWLPS
jgi:uncharacterized protein